MGQIQREKPQTLQGKELTRSRGIAIKGGGGAITCPSEQLYGSHARGSVGGVGRGGETSQNGCVEFLMDSGTSGAHQERRRCHRAEGKQKRRVNRKTPTGRTIHFADFFRVRRDMIKAI